MDEETSPQPIFRKSSLSHEVEIVSTNSTDFTTANPSDSLANTQGSTFAQKARAAELRAARARKQLKEIKRQSESNLPIASHEIVTFTKSRVRGKTWKTLNLNDLMEKSSEDDALEHFGIHSETVGETMDHKTTTQHGNAVSYDKILQNPLHSHQIKVAQSVGKPGMSPDSKKLAQSVASYDASQWDPEVQAKNSAPSLTSDSRPVLRQRSRTSSSTLCIQAIPVLTAASNRAQLEAEYLRQKQESQLLSLQGELQFHGMTEQTLNDARVSEITRDSMGPNPTQDQCSLRSTKSSSIVDTDEDPFAGFPPLLSSYSKPAYQPPQSPEETFCKSYNLVGPTPRPFVPHQYPAVKGTTSNLPHLKTDHPTDLDSYSAQYKNSASDSCSWPQYPIASMIQAPSVSYRKLSAEQKKDMLLQKLHAVADESSSSCLIPKFERTIMHDPLAYSRIKQNESSGGVSIPPKTKEDLVLASEPLPWKDRPVDIVSTPSLSNVEVPATDNKCLTPTGVIPTPNPDPEYHRNSSVFSKESLTEVERWWRHDTRVDHTWKRQVMEFMLSENRRKQAMGIPNRRSDNLDEWSENSPTPSTQEKSMGKAIAENLLIPVLANLASYSIPGGYFNKYGHVPEWCIDQGVGGQASFFGEDWGVPPPRVGRDPRYQPVLHEGTRSVYETFGGRWGGDGYSRRYR